MAREEAIDPRLIEILRASQHGLHFKPSDQIIHECVQFYIMGECDVAGMYIEIIKRLAAISDASIERDLKAAMLKPHPHFIPTKS